MTLKDFPINPEYTVPKGTMLIPSIWPSLHDPEVYPEPDSFIPERWLEPSTGEPIEDPNPKNYMVWGAGAHKVRCPYSPAGLHRRRSSPDPALFLSLACVWRPVHRVRVRLLLHDRVGRVRRDHDGLGT